MAITGVNNQTAIRPEAGPDSQRAPVTQPVQDKTPQLQQEGSAASQARDSLKQLAEQLSQQVRVEQRSLSFEINEDINRVVVVVTDSETKEVIRQIPSEQLVILAERLRALDESGSESSTELDGIGLLIQETA